jgi:phospholipid transport system substrate-binding protein
MWNLNKTLTSLAIAGTMIGTLLAGAGTALAADALGTIQGDNAKVQSITQTKTTAGTPAATAQEQQLKTMADQVLDLSTMAQQSLGKHWTELTPAQQTSFTTTFNELVKDNYVNQIRGSSGYTITYGTATPQGTDTLVDTTVKVTRNGHTDESDVQYLMRQVNGTWMVEDIVTDDESMIEDYQSEFGKVITTQGFDALQTHLQDRVTKLQAAE